MKLIHTPLTLEAMRRRSDGSLVVDRKPDFGSIAYSVLRPAGPWVAVPQVGGVATCSHFSRHFHFRTLKDVMRQAACGLCAKLISEDMGDRLEYYILEIFKHPMEDTYGVLAYEPERP